MKGVLVDTSVWIDFFNDISTKEAELLHSYIETDFPVYICATILQEILQGFSRDRDYQIAKDLLLSYPFLQTDPVEFAMGAAELYRRIKKRGKTIRKSNDCLIAYHAIFYHFPILHRDGDFSIISQHSKLKVVQTVV